jgi:hypothetical protein
MNNGSLQRVIPIVLVLIIIIVAVAALISLGRSLFGGGSTTEPIVNTGKDSLVNTSIDRSVRMTVRGPIVADENYHSYTITATPTARALTTYTGYLDTQVDTKDLPNSAKAYEEFVYALDRAELMEGTPLEGEANDTRGICATGRVYEFEVLQASNSIKKLWTSTCKDAKGSLDANVQQLIKLFQAQIPDYDDLTRKVKL